MRRKLRARSPSTAGALCLCVGASKSKLSFELHGLPYNLV
eukprot:CAMPEP_0172685106 /NCGR_PEP_ID=MMETSP1074-20121228/20014_1 /TAXON_ID=2916 /ORGANISM="Ceratium fusus, Strain PA161109" /LENGTH=39 /DNA_ID= /DNA_START= /DNA_END= /DNA_ORIENTATION=